MGRSMLRPYMIMARQQFFDSPWAGDYSGSVIVPLTRKVWPVPAALE
jgi:hypothetical protein